jgi:ribosomal peptide maturation radical SAM protein 1
MTFHATTAGTPGETAFNISLVSMPWSLFNRPSIQLGSLKAFLDREAEGLVVDDSYPYLEVASKLGPELYHWISQNSWVGEALYAAVIYPEQKAAAQKLALQYVKNANSIIQKHFDFDTTQTILKTKLKNWLEGKDWSKIRLVGFSVCFNQLLASLAAAQILKKKYPDICIVFGGSSCAGETGRSLVNTINEIDYVIEGEGEIPLLHLCQYLAGTRKTLPRNIFTKKKSANAKKNEREKSTAPQQIDFLADLPVPDYQGYFNIQQKLFQKTPFIPVLPIEFSRGCWWNKCAFCNLNLQWCGYRSKKAGQMVNEINVLSRLHGCLDFTFTDNMLPPSESIAFFQKTRKLPVDLNFFAEIRSVIQKGSIQKPFSIYSKGGLSTIQVGIESLSNSLLKRMNKGVSVIENIAAMRQSLENSITLDGNLIVQFPGSTQDEVDETLKNIRYVFPFTPLSIAAFFLGHDSPVARNPKQFGIKAITRHSHNARLFPAAVLKKLNLLVKGYRGDKTFQRKLWKPVVRQVTQWQNYHSSRKEGAIYKPLLSYRDGGNFLIIRQESADGTTFHHRLKGLSRQIYLFCIEIRTQEEIITEFQSMAPEKILSFLADLNHKLLLFIDDGRYLSLAVKNKNCMI